MSKTNAMRMLDKDKITYELLEYEVDESDLSGDSAANKLNVDREQMFKTLVLQTNKKEYIVCLIPVHENVDLKKAAEASGYKKVEMLPLKELLHVTGYIRGGCSPIGMKKQYATFIDETAYLFDDIYVSAGARGMTLKINSEDLIAYTSAKVIDLCKD